MSEYDEYDCLVETTLVTNRMNTLKEPPRDRVATYFVLFSSISILP